MPVMNVKQAGLWSTSITKQTVSLFLHTLIIPSFNLRKLVLTCSPTLVQTTSITNEAEQGMFV